MANEDTPKKGKQFEMYFPEYFLQDAAKRGATPEELMGRLMDLVALADKEARELFPDWDQRPKEDQLRWCLDFARERARLEYPYLDDGDESED